MILSKENLKTQRMIMTEKFKILAKYIKDMSSETPDIETFLFVKDVISKYQLNIDINSKALKNNPKVCRKPMDIKIIVQAEIRVINAILLGKNFIII